MFSLLHPAPDMKTRHWKQSPKSLVIQKEEQLFLSTDLEAHGSPELHPSFKIWLQGHLLQEAMPKRTIREDTAQGEP